MNLDDLAARVRGLVSPTRRVLIGITGMPGAGKTTLAEQLLARLRQHPVDGVPGDRWVSHVPMDGFHLADSELDRLGRRDRKGAPDTFDAAGYAALLARLRESDDEIVYAPSFQRDLEQPIAGSIPTFPQTRVVITEGNYLLLDAPPWPTVRHHLTEVWFCAVDEEARIRRLIARHERFGKSPEQARAWTLGTDQRNADLVAATAARADLIVSMDELDLSSPT